jgi:hypothetical protein
MHSAFLPPAWSDYLDRTWTATDCALTVRLAYLPLCIL